MNNFVSEDVGLEVSAVVLLGSFRYIMVLPRGSILVSLREKRRAAGFAAFRSMRQPVQQDIGSNIRYGIWGQTSLGIV